MDASMAPPIIGLVCPMGCGETLVSVPSGLGCSADGCPDADSVAKILSEAQNEHRVHFNRTSFTVRHPLAERVNSRLYDCKLYDYLSSLDEQPELSGEYRAFSDSTGAWFFESITTPPPLI